LRSCGPFSWAARQHRAVFRSHVPVCARAILLALPKRLLRRVVRGDLLQRLGRLDEARAAFTAAAALAVNTRERALLERRAASCVP
jgi:predicted RNA polymerase sigma factor